MAPGNACLGKGEVLRIAVLSGESVLETGQEGLVKGRNSDQLAGDTSAVWGAKAQHLGWGNDNIVGVIGGAVPSPTSPPQTRGIPSPIYLTFLFSVGSKFREDVLVSLFVCKETTAGKISLIHHLGRPIPNIWNSVPLEGPRTSLQSFNSGSSPDSHPRNQVRWPEAGQPWLSRSAGASSHIHPGTCAGHWY